MKAERHWAKAEQIEATMNVRLRRWEDFEMIVWSCIHASNQLLNVVLHLQRLTPDNQDQVHSDLPEYRGHVTPEVALIMASMQAIEELGPRFVRGIEPWESAEGERCLTAYAEVKRVATEVLRSEGHGQHAYS